MLFSYFPPKIIKRATKNCKFVGSSFSIRNLNISEKSSFWMILILETTFYCWHVLIFFIYLPNLKFKSWTDSKQHPHWAVFKTFGEHCVRLLYNTVLRSMHTERKSIPDVENVLIFFFLFFLPTDRPPYASDLLCLHHKLLDFQTTTTVH